MRKSSSRSGSVALSMQHLPNEIQLEIIALLDNSTLGRLYQVSKHFHNLIQHEENARTKVLANKIRDFVLCTVTESLQEGSDQLYNLDDCISNFLRIAQKQRPKHNFLKIHNEISKSIFSFGKNKKKGLIKLVILGEAGVGKTSLHNMFLIRQPRVTATIGWDFPVRTLCFGEAQVSVQCWDTAGQERFQSLGVAFYRGVDVAVFVLDVTSKKSLSCIPEWMEELKKSNSDLNIHPLMILVANKTDLPRVVTRQEVEQFAKENHMTFIETRWSGGF